MKSGYVGQRGSYFYFYTNKIIRKDYYQSPKNTQGEKYNGQINRIQQLPE